MEHLDIIHHLVSICVFVCTHMCIHELWQCFDLEQVDFASCLLFTCSRSHSACWWSPVASVSTRPVLGSVWALQVSRSGGWHVFVSASSVLLRPALCPQAILCGPHQWAPGPWPLVSLANEEPGRKWAGEERRSGYLFPWNPPHRVPLGWLCPSTTGHSSS